MSIGYQQGELYIESMSCAALAERFGTPLYAYSRQSIEQGWRRFDEALAGAPHRVCYAVKANSNLGVLNVLAQLGSGFDIVSGGELKRVLAAGGEPDQIVFSGVGKTTREIEHALEVGIHCFNIESEAELERLAELAAAHGVVAPVSVRVNPDVDARTHPYISTGLRDNKFGIDASRVLEVYRQAADMPSLAVVGIDCHIGSQLLELSPYADALARLMEQVDALAHMGIMLEHVDVGGGQGIRYQNEQSLDIDAWAGVVRAAVGERKLEIIVEPGRAVVGAAGVLLTRVEYLKDNGERHFAIVDAAMNDLIRPALYSAWHDIEPVRMREGDPVLHDIVGPVCESADFLGKQRDMVICTGDLLVVRSAGAYAFGMSSNYNTRPRAAEVLVSGDDACLVRAREEVENLFSREYLPL